MEQRAEEEEEDAGRRERTGAAGEEQESDQTWRSCNISLFSPLLAPSCPASPPPPPPPPPFLPPFLLADGVAVLGSGAGRRSLQGRAASRGREMTSLTASACMTQKDEFSAASFALASEVSLAEMLTLLVARTSSMLASSSLAGMTEVSDSRERAVPSQLCHFTLSSTSSYKPATMDPLDFCSFWMALRMDGKVSAEEDPQKTPTISSPHGIAFVTFAISFPHSATCSVASSLENAVQPNTTTDPADRNPTSIPDALCCALTWLRI
mmetsp:Transcript_71635/g.149493  ORF Transcript_71635/g.149493 Transcript_71635/m.149493 type:complete len:266 (-) Transcript_71635:70-867(-)